MKTVGQAQIITLKVKLAIIVTVLLWGSAFVGIRGALSDFSPGSLALLRYLIASLTMLPIYFSLRQRQALKKRHLPAVVILGMLGIGAYNITLNIGQQTVSAGIASFIVSQIPVIAIILATLVLKERMTKFSWLGLVISVVGVLIIAFGEHALGPEDLSETGAVMTHNGVWLVVIATFCAGIYSGLQKLLCGYYQPLQLVAWFVWFGTASLIGYLQPMLLELTQASWTAIAWVVFLGIFPGAIAYACWTYALKHSQACKTASYLFGMPIVATILGWLILDEIPTWLSLLGGCIALIGALMIKVYPEKTR